LSDLYGDLLSPLDKTVTLADGEVPLKTVAQGGREDGDWTVAGVVEVSQHQRTCSTTAHERLDARVTCRSPCQPRLPQQHAPHHTSVNDDSQPMTAHSRSVATVAPSLGFRDTDNLIFFSALRTFRPLLVTRWPYGHADRWVQLPAWGFMLVFYRYWRGCLSAARCK